MPNHTLEPAVEALPRTERDLALLRHPAGKRRTSQIDTEPAPQHLPGVDIPEQPRSAAS